MLPTFLLDLHFLLLLLHTELTSLVFLLEAHILFRGVKNEMICFCYQSCSIRLRLFFVKMLPSITSKFKVRWHSMIKLMLYDELLLLLGIKICIVSWKK